MNGEVGNERQTDEVELESVEKIDSVEEIDTVGDADNVGDISVEINVEELVAKVEAADGDDVSQNAEIKKRLDEMEDQLDKDDAFGSTYNFDIDEDLPT
jgi:hypothetical protein